MSYSCSRLPTATQDIFVPYVPKLTTPKPNTTKRKAKSNASEHESSGKKSIQNGGEIKGTSILSEPPLKSPTPLLTADSDTLDNEVTQAGAPTFYQNKPLCQVRERASNIVEKQNLADVGERNAIVDLSAADEKSNCAFIKEDFPFSCQFSGDGEYQQIIKDDPVNTGKSAPSTDEKFGCADDTPTSDSFSSQATSTSPEVGERSCSPAGVPICVAETSNCRLNPDRQGSLLDVWTARNTSELPNSSTVDACVSELRPDCGNEHTLSTGATVFDVHDRVENAPNSETNSQELLRSEDGSISFSEAVDQEVMSQLTESRDEDIQSDIGFSGSHRRGSRALSGDEGDRYPVEKIMDHDEYDGRKRYRVKWLGWPEEDITWEPESNLDECKELLQDYWARLENHNSTGNITKTEARSSRSSDRMRDDRASLPQIMADISNQLGQGPLHLQNSLVAQLVQAEALDRAASGCTARKRKLYQDGQGFLDEDGENLDAYSDTGVRRTTDKPRKRRCRTCRATGHNVQSDGT